MLSNFYIVFIINKNKKVILFYGFVWVEESECVWQNFQNKKEINVVKLGCEVDLET